MHDNQGGSGGECKKISTGDTKNVGGRLYLIKRKKNYRGFIMAELTKMIFLFGFYKRVAPCFM